MRKLYDGYERLDLTEGMRHEDDPAGPDSRWWAGDQMKALEYYAPCKLHLLCYLTEEAYQGEIYAICYWADAVPENRRFVLLYDSFGSCSGCDALEGGDNGYEYVQDVLRSNTKQFMTMQDMKEYISQSDAYIEAVRDGLLGLCNVLEIYNEGEWGSSWTPCISDNVCKFWWADQREKEIKESRAKYASSLAGSLYLTYGDKLDNETFKKKLW